LSYTKLDVRKDKFSVKIDGLLVIFSGIRVFTLDEVQLGSVVVDVRVFAIVFYGLLEVRLGLIR
jgi:hypothetical protein